MNYILLAWVYATKTFATAPDITILVMLPHVPSNGALPLCFFYLFLICFFVGFLDAVSAVVGNGQDLHVVLPHVFSYTGPAAAMVLPRSGPRRPRSHRGQLHIIGAPVQMRCIQ